MSSDITLKKTILVLVAGLTLGLGACSDEPSEAVMSKAVTHAISKLYNQQAAAAVFLAGPRGGIPPMPTITKFRKIGCVSAEPNAGHLCEFEAALDGKDMGKDRARFSKAPDGTFEADLRVPVAAR